jgi:site-specific DNA-methyltransferase (adenine-specific)
MQLDLLLTIEKETGVENQLCWIPVDKLVPHPRNPRRGQPDKLESIAQSMKEEGYRLEKPMLVRPYTDGNYQIIGGHTRYQAAKMAGLEKVLCVVEKMDNDTAILRIGQDNLNDPFSWFSQCIYVAQNSVKGSKTGLSRTALITASTGKEGKAAESESVIKGNVGEFLLWCEEQSRHVSGLLNPEVNLTRHIYAIQKAPDRYWQQLTELLIEKEWSVKQTEAIVAAIKEVDIPPQLHSFLNPEYWVKKVISDATSDNPQGLQKKVALWVGSAVENLETLSTEQGVWQFDDSGNPSFELINLQDKFLSKLPELVNGDQVPSKKKIDQVSQSITDWVEACNQKYKKWQKAQSSKEESARQQREENERIKALRVKYAPTGIDADLRSLTLADLGGKQFDAIITDPPYLLSNNGFTVRSGKEASVNKNFDDTEGSAISPEEWVPLVSQWLKPGGVLVATCTLHIYHRLIESAEAAGLETTREQAIWLKPNSPPQLSPTLLQPDFEYIFLAFKPDDHCYHYFGYDEYRKNWGDQPSRTFIIPQCGGDERLHWHDTQKPLELFEKLITLYVPPDGLVLDPFSGSGTTAVAAKKLGRIAYWIEKDPGHYAKSEHRIETAPFSWEVANG